MLTSLRSACLKYRPQSLQTRLISNDIWIHNIKAKNADVNALVFVPDALEHGTSDLPLNDVAVAIKDNICTKSMPTTCSSKILYNFTSPFDATVVELLRNAGASVVGKANCDEFGMGCVTRLQMQRPLTQIFRYRSMNIYSDHGPVVNPYQSPSASVPWHNRERRSAGGSSGGSAAAVAAGMCNACVLSSY